MLRLPNPNHHNWTWPHPAAYAAWVRKDHHGGAVALAEALLAYTRNMPEQAAQATKASGAVPMGMPGTQRAKATPRPWPHQQGPLTERQAALVTWAASPRAQAWLSRHITALSTYLLTNPEAEGDLTAPPQAGYGGPPPWPPKILWHDP